MPDWLKVLVIIVVLGGWLATVIASLARGELPNAGILGVPAIIVAAVAPPATLSRRRRERRADDEDAG